MISFLVCDSYWNHIYFIYRIIWCKKYSKSIESFPWTILLDFMSDCDLETITKSMQVDMHNFRSPKHVQDTWVSMLELGID